MNRRAITRRLLPAACVGLGLTAAADAQSLVRTLNGDAIYDRMGADIANAGDVDGDGQPDMIVGAPEDYMVFFNEPGYARIFSGADGSIIRTLSGDQDFDLFGSAVAGIGDVNNDGRAEVAVGASYAVPQGQTASHGFVRVFDGATGSVLWTVYGDQGDEFGFCVAGAGDVDGDGVPDVVAGAPRADAQGGALSSAGKARVLSGVDGSLIHEIEGTAGNQRLGYSVAGMGNVNPDDVVAYGNPPAPGPDIFDDVIVGSLFGGAKVYSGFNKNVLATYNSASSDVYGRAVASLGDLNGDGVREAVIGATQDDFFNPGAGYVHVRSGKKGTGQVLFTLDGTNSGERFGVDVADGGDWDGDGKNDILVGTSPNDNAIPAYAAMYSGNDGSLMFTIDELVSGDLTGFAVAGLGDGDADGKAEIAVGAPSAQPNNLGSGHARVYESPFASCGQEIVYCAATANSSGSPATLQNLGSTSVAANDLVLFASSLPQVPASNPGVFFYGNNQTSVPFGGGTLCVAGPFIKRIGFVPAQPGGFALTGMDFTSEPAAEYQITPGSTWYFQYWFRDSQSGTGPNFTNALEIHFCE